MKPKALIMTGYGINCDLETRQAFEIAGADAKIVHINDLIDTPSLGDYQILAIPGGFSYGDDTGSGNAFANRIRNNMWEQILSFVESDKLVLGICNGFQVLVNLGLVPALNKDYGNLQSALTFNDDARYNCLWIDLKAEKNNCIFTQGIDRIRIPVAHGEGKFYADDKTLAKLYLQEQIVFKYVKPNGSPANAEFPYSPNGSLEDIAAISDSTGRILGMMPHPERTIYPTQLDNWPVLKRKGELPEEGPGMQIFRNAVRYFI